MTFSKKALLLLALLGISPAAAQWQVPVNTIPVGRGPGVTGFNSVSGSAGAGAKCLVDTVPPSFGTCFGGSLPPPQVATLGGVFSKTAIASQWFRQLDTLGNFTSSQPAFTDISGQNTLAQLPTIASGTVLANATAGAAVPTAASATSWFDRAYCSTVGYIIARTSGAWTCNGNIPINAVWLCAVGNNSTLNDTCFTSTIIPAAVASGAKIFIPAGIYRFSGAITQPANVTVECENRANTYLRTTSAAADQWIMDGAQTFLNNCTLDASVTRSGGYALKWTTNASNTGAYQTRILAPFQGIYIPTVAILRLVNVDITDTVATTGRSIVVDGGFALLFDHVVASAQSGAKPSSHLTVNNVADLTVTASQFICADQVWVLDPGNGQSIGEILAANTQVDCPGSQAIRIVPTGTGTVYRIQIDNAWIACSAGNTNLLITNAGGGTSNGGQISNSTFPGCTTSTAIALTGASNWGFLGNRIGGHATGISLADALHTRIIGNRVGPTDQYGVNTFGVFISGTTNYTTMVGNDVQGNTTNVTYSASGTSNQIQANVGYPATISLAGITVGASPYTYTAGPTPETVCVNSGTVSLIAISGTGALQSSNHCIALGPNQTLTVTYSVLPSMTKSINP